MVSLTWPAARAWRVGRHLLDPVRPASTRDVVDALGAVAAQADPTWSELGIRTRRLASHAGDVRRALDDGDVLATFAFRGAVHLMTPDSAAVHLALRASSRMWEGAGWREFYGLQPGDWPDLVATVREVLAPGPMTRAELGAAVTGRPAYAHLRKAFTDPALTFLKPLAWQGALCFGRPRGGAATFQLPDTSPGWPGVVDLDDAGPRAVEAYLRAYAPASPDNLVSWLTQGLGVRRAHLPRWIGALGDRVQTMDVEGQERYALTEDVETLAAARPSTAVQLLPKYDQWLLGPGTADTAVVPAAVRADVSRGAHVVLVGGTFAGTWALAGERFVPSWASGVTPPAPDVLAAEVTRLGEMLGRTLVP